MSTNPTRSTWTTEKSAEKREFIIVGQEQGTSYTLWDVAPAPLDDTERAKYLEEIGVDAADAFGAVTLEWADSPRGAVDMLIAALREQSGLADYGLSPDSQTDCLGPDPTPEPEQPTAAQALSVAHRTGYNVTAVSEPGTASVVIDGLPVWPTLETRDRVRAGALNSGLAWPQTRLTITLTPSGEIDDDSGTSGLDLAIACTALAAGGQLHPDRLAGVTLIGELGLDGAVRTPQDVTGLVWAAVDAGAKTLLLPDGAVGDVGQIPGVLMLGVHTLNEALATLAGR